MLVSRPTDCYLLKNEMPETTDWVASDSLFGAGVFSGHIGPPGTRGPEGDWDEDHFFSLIVSAVRK
jgi:hypothetical protein